MYTLKVNHQGFGKPPLDFKDEKEQTLKNSTHYAQE